jgi:hypothetical protein
MNLSLNKSPQRVNNPVLLPSIKFYQAIVNRKIGNELSISPEIHFKVDLIIIGIIIEKVENQ